MIPVEKSDLVPVTSATRARLDALLAHARETDDKGLAMLASWFSSTTVMAPDETWNAEGFIIVARTESGERDAGWVTMGYMRLERGATIGLYLLPLYRGGGVAQGAMRMLMEVARMRGLHRLEARIDADNAKSNRLVQKGRSLGWKKAGVLRDSKWRAGEYVSQVIWDCILGERRHPPPPRGRLRSAARLPRAGARH